MLLGGLFAELVQLVEVLLLSFKVADDLFFLNELLSQGVDLGRFQLSRQAHLHLILLLVELLELDLHD